MAAQILAQNQLIINKGDGRYWIMIDCFYFKHEWYEPQALCHATNDPKLDS